MRCQKHTNISLLGWIKRVDDLAVETCTVGPALPFPADMCTYTHTHYPPQSSSPKALANYYHHQHSEGPPTAWFCLIHNTHTVLTKKTKQYTAYSVLIFCLKLLQYSVHFCAPHVSAPSPEIFKCFCINSDWRGRVGDGKRSRHFFFFTYNLSTIPRQLSLK